MAFNNPQFHFEKRKQKDENRDPIRNYNLRCLGVGACDRDLYYSNII